jgi:hypothetical protein
MSGLSRTPGKRVYGESRTAGSNPALSASQMLAVTLRAGTRHLTRQTKAGAPLSTES